MFLVHDEKEAIDECIIFKEDKINFEQEILFIHKNMMTFCFQGFSFFFLQIRPKKVAV